MANDVKDPGEGRVGAIRALYPKNPDVRWLIAERERLRGLLDEATEMLATAEPYAPGPFLDRCEKVLGWRIERNVE